MHINTTPSTDIMVRDVKQDPQGHKRILLREILYASIDKIDVTTVGTAQRTVRHRPRRPHQTGRGRLMPVGPNGDNKRVALIALAGKPRRSV